MRSRAIAPAPHPLPLPARGRGAETSHFPCGSCSKRDRALATPPFCGEGQGWGSVGSACEADVITPGAPHPVPLPARGRGAETSHHLDAVTASPLGVSSCCSMVAQLASQPVSGSAACVSLLRRICALASHCAVTGAVRNRNSRDQQFVEREIPVHARKPDHRRDQRAADPSVVAFVGACSRRIMSGSFASPKEPTNRKNAPMRVKPPPALLRQMPSSTPARCRAAGTCRTPRSTQSPPSRRAAPPRTPSCEAKRMPASTMAAIVLITMVSSASTRSSGPVP